MAYWEAGFCLSLLAAKVLQTSSTATCHALRHGYELYMQFSDAVPLTLGEVLSMVLLIVIVRSTGAVALTVTTPWPTQVAVPESSMVATAVFDVAQVRPSARVSWRLLLLSNFPVAVYVAVPLLFVTAAAVGETIIWLSLACPAPHPKRTAI